MEYICKIYFLLFYSVRQELKAETLSIHLRHEQYYLFGLST